MIGPHGPQGAFVCGAFSGFGIMSCSAAGELIAHTVAKNLQLPGGASPLPDYAKDFLPTTAIQAAVDRHGHAGDHQPSLQL